MYSRQLRSAIWFVFAVVSLAVARPRHQVAAGPHLRRMMLSRSEDNDWEPSVAVGPNAAVYVTAIRSDAARERAVIWSSHDGGRSFGSATMPDSTGGQGDVRVKTDDNGTIYVSSIGRGLDLATSRDGGKTFATRTIETQELRDKPELAVSLSGRDLPPDRASLMALRLQGALAIQVMIQVPLRSAHHYRQNEIETSFTDRPPITWSFRRSRSTIPPWHLAT